MKLRKLVMLAVAVPALIASTATPGNAAATGGVVFAGTVTIVPTPAPGTNTVKVCFAAPAASCPNGAASTGAAAGTAVVNGAPVVVLGLQATVVYNEVCDPVFGVAATGSASMDVQFLTSSGWDTTTVDVGWTREGVAVVLNGENGDTVAGAAVLVPTALPVCGQSVTVAASGTAVANAS